MKGAGRVAVLLLYGCAGGSAAVAQIQMRTISARAGTIGYQQGFVFVDGNRAHSTSGKPPFQMKNGQQLHVESGRVELLLGSGVYLRMLGASSIRMQETLLTDTRVLVEKGSAIIEVAGMNKAAQLHVICGETTTELKRDGLYQFDAPFESKNESKKDDAMKEKLRIYTGDASVERAGNAVKARSGQAVDLASALELVKFDVKQADALHSWSAQRTKRRVDAAQRRMQSRLMQAARNQLELDQPSNGGSSKRAQDQSSKGPQF